MKNFLLTILLTTSVVFAALYFRSATQIAERDARLGEVQAQLAEHEAQKAKALAAATEAKRETAGLRAELEAGAARLAIAQTAKAAASSATAAGARTNAAAGKGAKGLAGLFDNPEMKEMMSSQQKLVMGPMVDKMFGPLFQQLQMNDEQKGFLKDLLTKKMLAGAESGLELLGGDVDPARRKEITEKIKKDTAGYDAQIKDYLGEQYYPQFKEYEKTQGERMQFDQFREQVAAGANALSTQQQDQLFQAMVQQREAFKWTTDYSDQNKVTENMADYFTEAKLATFTTEKERYDKELLARAQSLLTPEQFKSYEQFVNAQRQMQLTGMKMAAAMFAPKQ